MFPVLLNDLHAPMLRLYPVCCVIAEKYQAMTIPGLASNRRKNFFDIATIARHSTTPVSQRLAAQDTVISWIDPVENQHHERRS